MYCNALVEKLSKLEVHYKEKANRAQHLLSLEENIPKTSQQVNSVHQSYFHISSE